MNLFANDYLNLYNMQDKVFQVLAGFYGNLYLTGVTPLGRFYLKHRYSDDIDLFTNAIASFKDTVTRIRQIIDSHFGTITD